jgi:hypothetical protein
MVLLTCLAVGRLAGLKGRLLSKFKWLIIISCGIDHLIGYKNFFVVVRE